MTNPRRFLLAVTVALVAGCGRSQPSGNEAKTAPELKGALTWLNSPAITLGSLRGRVVLIDFFEYSCVNCIRTLPYLKEWQRRYAAFGLATVIVHTPQYGFSMDPANVYAGLKRLKVTFPVAVDSEFKIADAYGNRFWPRVFLIDESGTIRYEHTGEGGYAETEANIQKLLREIDPSVTLPALLPPVRAVDRPGAVCQPTTPELYLGKTRGALGNPSTNDTLQLPDQRDEGRIYAAGQWSNQAEYLRHAGDTDDLSDFVALKYRAVEFNVVMKPEYNYFMEVFVKQDDHWLPKDVAGDDIKFDVEGRSYVQVDAARMYNLVATQPYGTYEIRLYVKGKGLSLYSFSFGTCETTQNADKFSPAKEKS